METKAFWEGWWSKFESSEWADAPSLFAQFAISYFPKQGNLLELGAGLGKDSRYFVRSGYEVTSSDFSDSALRISQWETQMQRLKMEYINFDLRQPFPFEDEKFDIVYSHAVLHYFNHQTTDQIFREIHRVTKPKGIVATLLKSKEDPEVLKSLKLGENFYKTPAGLVERFFSVDEIHTEVAGLFNPIVMDSSEQTHETENATFIRFIGTKIEKGKQQPHPAPNN